jgi:uncharacterized cupredoxin-like copper-binding protein
MRIRVLARTVVATLALALVIAGVAGATTHAAKGTTVNVKMTEFKFALSTSKVAAGSITFKLKNAGHLAHDFKINGKKSALIQPGKSGTLKVILKKGSYKYICTVAGHASFGMHGTLRVT